MTDAAASTRLIVANTFPKSGTGLLRQILSPLGQDRGHVTFNPGQGADVDVIDRSLADTLSRVGSHADGVMTAHLHYWRSIAELIGDRAFLFLYRDPRDVVVSHARYVSDTPGHRLHRHYSSLPDWDARVRTSILGVSETDLGDVGRRLLPYLPWHLDPRVFSISFERLQGEREAAVADIAEFLGVRERTEEMLAAVKPSESATFRKGEVGGWRDEMSEANQALFEDVTGWTLKALGYDE